MDINFAVLDIETRCNIPDCPGQKEMTACKHGLYPWTSDFVCAGIYTQENNGYSIVCHTLDELRNFIHSNPNTKFVGHNFKFDLNYLHHKGVHIAEGKWAHDTMYMAHTCIHKVPKEYLEKYELDRKERQKVTGIKYRPGKKYSLKVLAPYFIKVDPFWETDVDDDLYVLKDCEYTYKLALVLMNQMQKEGTYDFYKNKLLPWAKTIMHAERRGILINNKLLSKRHTETKKKHKELIKQIDTIWKPAYQAYVANEKDKMAMRYAEMGLLAKNKLKDPTPEKLKRKDEQYTKLFKNALTKLPKKLDLNSPQQVLWILKDYFNYPVKNVKGKESTAKAILNSLAETHDPNLKIFLDYREQEKLMSSFFPVYEEKQHKEILHCNFNIAGTRTGRLSSSGPNLQQVPGHLHELFIARPGHLLATYDMAAIETMLIAYYTEDPILLDIIFSDTDFHGYNAKLYFPEITCSANEVKEKYKKERDFAKRLGYALFYGARTNRIYETAKEMHFNFPKPRCKEIFENFAETYRQVLEFKEELDARATKEPIMNMFGRFHSFPNPEDIYMKNMNTLIQGSASDMVLNSARRIDTKRNYNVLLLVHDEIVTEIKEEDANKAKYEIPHFMTDYTLETAMGRLPLKVEGTIAPHWKKE